ncbi:MAG: M48 family metalloprotease [Chlamydiales bacterium]|nr:M48 family metalloprotease [Chlamydiales bacterium]
MINKFVSSLSMLLLGVSIAFGATHEPPPTEGIFPPRKDQLDDSSQYAKIRLKRAENILGTLVPNPQSYHLILSSITTFGGEAVPPFVFSDKPTVILYQGSLSPDRSNEEIAFMMAHELGHLELHHHDEMDKQMEKIFTSSPLQISGLTFSVYFQKLQERQADLFGLALYRDAGYDLNFFPTTLELVTRNPNIHFGTNNPFRTELSSLSYHNSHFSIKERFELLTKEAQKPVV